MLRLAPSLLLSRRRAATIVALLLAAQLSLFAHAVGHDYLNDADQSHVVCGLCIAAHHLDNGVAPAGFEFGHAGQHLLMASAPSVVAARASFTPFQARAPPVSLPL